MTLDFDQSKHALDRFRGEKVRIFSTFVAPGEHLPGQSHAEVELRHIEIESTMVEVGETAAERAVRAKEQRRFLEFGDGTAMPWRMPEETYEGAIWIVADRELKISGGAGAVHFCSAKTLPPAERVYGVTRIEYDETQLPPTNFQSDRRLLRGDRIKVDGHFWSVDKAEDIDGVPPWILIRRQLP